MNAQHTKGRWVYTSACPRFEGDTDKVRGFAGSIHAGWEDSPEFATAEEFYVWATAECDRRNTVATAAPELLEALKRNRAALDLIDPARPLQYATTMDLMRKDMDAAIALATPKPASGEPEGGAS